MTKTVNRNVLELRIYQGAGEINSNDFRKENLKMIYFEHFSSWLSGFTGNSSFIAKAISYELSQSLSISPRIHEVKFDFGKDSHSFNYYGDGYFGRPSFWTGATLLRPLQEDRREPLRRELEKIGSIKDRKGRTVELSVI